MSTGPCQFENGLRNRTPSSSLAWNEVLETYAMAYDPQHPVLCMDEQPVQLLKETRVSIAATKDHGKRVDYEYERNGTASIFMFAFPLSGFRKTTARKRRTKVDWATEVAGLLDTRYIDGEKVTIVLDNLNTHTKGAFYEAFEPAVARAYLKRIDFVLTPKHGSWLNVAECELSCMTSQCLTGRQTQRSASRDRCLVEPNQREAARRRLAIQDRKRSHQTKDALPNK